MFSPPTATLTRPDDPRVAGFVRAHRLDAYLNAAVRLAQKCFPRAKGITLGVVGEPGEYGESLFLDVATGAGADESLRQYDEFVARWVAATPPWVTDLMGISTDLR